MACEGCKKSRMKFKKELDMAKEVKEVKEVKELDMAKEVKEVKEVKVQLSFEEKQREHFKKVCPHGVPDGFKCKTCDKVISIPEDAVIKEE